MLYRQVYRYLTAVADLNLKSLIWRYRKIRFSHASADLLNNADTDEMSINSRCTPTERCSWYVHRRVGGNAQIRVENLPLSSIIRQYQKYLGKRDNPQSFSGSLLKRSCKVFCLTLLSSFPCTQQLTPTEIKEMLQHQAARLVQKKLVAKHSDYLNKYSMDLTTLSNWNVRYQSVVNWYS